MLAEVKKLTAQLLVAVSKKVSSQKQVMRRGNRGKKFNFHSLNPRSITRKSARCMEGGGVDAAVTTWWNMPLLHILAAWCTVYMAWIRHSPSPASHLIDFCTLLLPMKTVAATS